VPPPVDRRAWLEQAARGKVVLDRRGRDLTRT
jgi:hypothetical protein